MTEAAEPLTSGEVRQLLRECVTVVKPGETLVIRARDNWSPEQVQYYQELLDQTTDSGFISFRAVVVVGEELGVAEGTDGG